MIEPALQTSERSASVAVPTVIFLHIPKTAGRTLFYLISQQFARQPFYDTDAMRLNESIAEFKQLPEERRRALRIVKGHMTFGLHQWLPQPSTYLTMFREPVDHVLSHYYFIMRSPKHHLYEHMTSRQMSLEDYVRSGISPTADNEHVRMVSGRANVPTAPFDHGGVPCGSCTREMLDEAKLNLERYFSVVGLTESFDASLKLMERAYGWKFGSYQRLNVTEGRPRVKDISASTREVIEKHNALDIELYEFAKQRFTQLCHQHQIAPEGVADGVAHAMASSS